ncbi:MAG: nitrite reductase small subunit NirD [Chitinophagaceae bacterium]|nr:MAG: nitrite reductase small subunit NirD [Chitinophagaceae bacterium]
MSLNNEADLIKEAVWFAACRVEDAVPNAGVCVRYQDKQIALFYFSRQNKWFATQNECPHKKQMALSRGMIGTLGDEPKVACPFHKKTFSLVNGHCLSGDECAIRTYPVRIENDFVYINVGT